MDIFVTYIFSLSLFLEILFYCYLHSGTLRDMWDLNSPAKGQTCATCRGSRVLAAGLPRKSPHTHFLSQHFLSPASVSPLLSGLLLIFSFQDAEIHGPRGGGVRPTPLISSKRKPRPDTGKGLPRVTQSVRTEPDWRGGSEHPGGGHFPAVCPEVRHRTSLSLSFHICTMGRRSPSWTIVRTRNSGGDVN